MARLKNILITGGAGFIGSNFIHFFFKENPSFDGRVINLDALTYAGNLMNLSVIEKQWGGKHYFFEKGDIRNADLLQSLFRKYEIDTVIHFAAESHVDRSILNAGNFIETNIIGTFTLLEAVKKYWNEKKILTGDVLFHHISTDEVYGSLGETGFFSETTPYDPRSPYSASKAGSDHLVMAYSHTYELPVTLSNCSNNYGPYQFPEKLIPLMILNIMDGKTLPVYGDGRNVRDWIYVDDHCRAVLGIMQRGKRGQKYNIGGGNEYENIKLLHLLIDIIAEKTGIDPEAARRTISYVKDRPGHDRRYAIDFSLIKNELGWNPLTDLKTGLEKTVEWYLHNHDWIDSIRNGEYRNWITANYSERE